MAQQMHLHFVHLFVLFFTPELTSYFSLYVSGSNKYCSVDNARVSSLKRRFTVLYYASVTSDVHKNPYGVRQTS